MAKVRFHLPGLRYNYPLNMIWVSLFEKHPEYFRDDVEIASFFGCFPVSLWNGGRLIQHDQCDATFVKTVVKNINDKGIPVRYTFSNPLIDEHDLKDPFCNFCMEVADNGMNEVMIFSPLLEEYIRDKYPSFALNSSTCKEIKDVKAINDEIAKDYKYVVLDYNLNNNFDFISQIEHPEKLEILINAVCEPGCKRRGEHYRNISRNQRAVLLNRALPKDKQIPIEPWSCPYSERNCLYNIMDYSTFVSVEDIYDKYVPAGINNFKIEGRTDNIFSLVETYSYYMIKPEHQGVVRIMILSSLASQNIISVNRPRPGQWP